MKKLINKMESVIEMILRLCVYVYAYIVVCKDLNTLCIPAILSCSTGDELKHFGFTNGKYIYCRIDLYCVDIFNTVAHEIRHIWQLKNGFDFSDYVANPEDFDEYWNHPAEIDAREYARKITSKHESNVEALQWSYIKSSIIRIPSKIAFRIERRINKLIRKALIYRSYFLSGCKKTIALTICALTITIAMIPTKSEAPSFEVKGYSYMTTEGIVEYAIICEE